MRGLSLRPGLPLRLLALIVPVCLAGLGVVVAAATSFAASGPSATTLLGVAGLLAASTVAERFPVPVEGVDAGGVSLAFSFGIGAIVLFGWAPGVIVMFGATTIMQLLEHRPPVRVAYNAAVFALGAAAAGAAIVPIGHETAQLVVASVGVAGFVQYTLNMALIDLVISIDSGRTLPGLVASSVRWTALPFTLMGSATVILVVLWQRTPYLAVTLIGPLLAIALYQRSNYRALRAMRLALTDPLTGLGNHRHFHERLQRELVDSEAHGRSLTLALMDIDDFKRINDRFGHPVGDRVLSQLATRFRQDGETFRLGGDEFAILFPGFDEQAALEAGASIVDRIASLQLDHGGSATVSIGVATFPAHARDRDELIRLADSALYWAKEHGKNRVRVYRPAVVELAELKRLASGPDQAARFRAAASLAKAVDARDTYTGSHSERVAELAARIATRLGLGAEDVELARLAGSLHDLGKLAIPEEILRKPGPLTEPERLVLERHPQIGYRMLESLGVDPVADWVLHHHERWDGDGYPDRLVGDGIPLGARILFVADAYDAMTSDRVYRRRLTQAAALAELERCAGSQFDAEIVSALAEEVGYVPTDASALAS